MSRARDLGSSINSNIPGKNLVINGGFDFWQRGTTWSGTGYSAADRWYAVLSGSVTMTQETSDLPAVGQIRYGARWTTTANASYGQLYQSFEENLVRSIRGKLVTVSGYIKISGTYSGSQYLNTDYNTSSDALISQSTNNTSTPIGNAVDAASWKYFSVPVIVPSNAVGFRIGFIPDQAQPSGAIVRLAAVQMEIGSATQFSRAGGDIQGELIKCQRYFQRVENNVSTYLSLTLNYLPNFNNSYSQAVLFPVPMRSSVSLSFFDVANNSGKVTAYLNGGGVNNITPTINQSSGSGFRMFVSGEYRYLDFYGTTASAEL
jgi:hypothetical protein